MNLLPARDSLPGVGLYYLTVLVFVVAGVNAWTGKDVLVISITGLAFVFLLVQDVLWFRRCTFAPQDRALIEKLTQRFEDRLTRELLTQTDFTRHGFSLNNLKHLQEINDEWTGIDHEFRDKSCRQAWSQLKDRIHELLDLLHAQGHAQNAYNFSICYTAGDDFEGDNHAETANQKAREIFRLYQQLRKVYIRKMPFF